MCVPVSNNTCYCRQCYRIMPNDDEDGNPLDSEQKKKKYKQSKMGYHSCQEQICKQCWPTYDHMLAE